MAVASSRATSHITAGNPEIATIWGAYSAVGTQIGRPSLPWFFIVFLAVTISAALVPAAAETATATNTIIDGDTLEINGKTVRLYGIDAPELGQYCMNGANRYRCGYEAALALTKLVGSGPVECRPTPVDSNDEGQICSVGLVDLAEAMLRRGYAVAPPSSFAVYRRAEKEAKQGRLGIWRGDFVLPPEWRAGRRLQTQNNEPKQNCDIKGIVSDKGERVYLVNTDPDYANVEIEQPRGERIFCSDDEAELAGWRRWPKSAVRERTAAPK
jgi:endonuclease YncB( thermonuclease family)